MFGGIAEFESALIQQPPSRGHGSGPAARFIRRSNETFRTSADAWAAGIVVLQTSD